MAERIKRMVLSIGDVHFGSRAVPADDMLDQFKDTLSRLDRRLDAEQSAVELAVVDGDWFDKGLPLSSPEAAAAVEGLCCLIKWCEHHAAKLRVLTGTRSHDLDQLATLAPVGWNSVPGGVEFHSSAAAEDFSLGGGEGWRILYVPEECPENMEAHYRDLVWEAPDRSYDLAFMHGTFDWMAFDSQVIESERPHPSAPVWDEKRFLRIVKGPVLAGHIHKKVDWGKRIFYHSSFSRLSFGEDDDPKGINLAFQDPESGEWTVEHFENTAAPRRSTIRPEMSETPAEFANRAAAWLADRREWRGRTGRDTLRLDLYGEWLADHPEGLRFLGDFKTGKRGLAIKAPKAASAKDDPAETERKRSKYEYLETGHLQPVATLRRYIREERGEDLADGDIAESIKTEKEK